MFALYYKSLLLLTLRIILFLSVGLFLPFAFQGQPEELSRWWSVIVSLCNIATIFLLLLLCRSKETTYSRFINFEKGKTTLKSAIITVIVVLSVGIGGIQVAGLICYGEMPHFPIVMIQPIPLWIALLNVLILPLTTTLAEDGIYLGVLNQTDSKVALVSSIFFYAFQHCFIPFLPDFTFILYRFLSFLPLTIIMCLWYRKTRNPLPFMAGHFVINLATVAQIVMTSVSPELYEQMKALS